MVITGLSIIMLAGVISIFIGRQHIEKIKNSIAKTEHYQQEHIQRNVQFFNKEIGLLLYHLRFGLVNQPSPLNALSIGQRDVNSSIQHVTIRNLQNQQYDTDLFNPYSLLAGNLDFSFVLIYLFPLLIIAFTYNLLSEEKEGGTWRLVSAQKNKPATLILQKLAVRAAVIFTALFVLVVLAAVILALPIDDSFWATVSLSFSYLLCWFAIGFWVASLKKQSGVNAVLLLSSWLLLTVICPGMANNYITSKYPVPEALATVVKQREGYHEKWDMDKEVTMDKFYAHYPQFSKYPIPNTQFSWLWYYAMQQMGDDEAELEAIEMMNKLQQREIASRTISWFVPSMHTQYQLNTLAQSGLGNHLEFLDSTKQFHENKRLHFYPKIFAAANVSEEKWSDFKVMRFTENSRVAWDSLLMPLFIITILLAGVSRINFRKTSN
jgi:ABC-2 type transport system permease protein